MAYRIEPMGENYDSVVPAGSLHVLLDDAFGLVIQRSGGFIEYQNARIGYQLALVTGKTGAMLANPSVVIFGKFQNGVVCTSKMGDCMTVSCCAPEAVTGPVAMACSSREPVIPAF